MDLNKLKKFFDERPALKPDGVGKEAGLPQSLLGKILRGERTLTDTYIQRLLPILKKYGYK
jgi:chromosome partitioning protein